MDATADLKASWIGLKGGNRRFAVSGSELYDVTPAECISTIELSEPSRWPLADKICLQGGRVVRKASPDDLVDLAAMLVDARTTLRHV